MNQNPVYVGWGCGMGLVCSGLVKKGEEFLKGLCDWETVQPVRDNGLAKESALIAGGNNHQTEAGREEDLYPHVQPLGG
ncbi:tRNA-dihydrouridine synthase 1 [Aspergillus luchuensis]|uniref:tRNA-dihydrouridine synthase 1 n=1 Tax=Aspergillus kawachii TaxID=1069201 RepID=A0A146FR20_ASPKA|nr:tRNA-dihydrouridine synthase 1 [Aspergillus luchuensis]